MTKQTPHTKKNCNRKCTLERSVETLLGRLKPILLARNLTLNSDAAPNYKQMFGLHRHPLYHSETHTIKHFDETKQLKDSVAIWSQNTGNTQSGPRWALIGADHLKQFEWGASILSEDRTAAVQLKWETKLSIIIGLKNTDAVCSRIFL